MTVVLPKGFKPVPTGRKPSVTFDVDKNRFYISRSLLAEHRIQKGGRVGLAYNPVERQLLIDKRGRAFYVDKRGYITSKHFIERAYGRSNVKGKESVHYVVNTELTSEHFLVLDETD